MFAELQFVHSFSIHSFVRSLIHWHSVNWIQVIFSHFYLSVYWECLLHCRHCHNCLHCVASVSLDVLLLLLWSVFACRHFHCVTIRLPTVYMVRLQWPPIDVYPNSDFHNGGRQYKLMTNTIISVVQIDPIASAALCACFIYPQKLIEYFSNIIVFGAHFFSLLSCSSLLMGCRDGLVLFHRWFFIFGEKSKTRRYKIS